MLIRILISMLVHTLMCILKVVVVLMPMLLPPPLRFAIAVFSPRSSHRPHDKASAATHRVRNMTAYGRRFMTALLVLSLGEERGGDIAAELLRLCSRHKHWEPPRETPADYWELSFVDSIQERKLKSSKRGDGRRYSSSSDWE